MRRLLATMAALLACVAVFAQVKLDGTWHCRTGTDGEKIEQGGVEIQLKTALDVTWTFSGNNYTMSVATSVTMSQAPSANKDAMVINIEATGSGAGKLAAGGGRLTLTPDKKRKPKVEASVDVDNLPGASLARPMIVSATKKELAASLKEVQEYKIISIRQNELTLETIPDESDIKNGVKAERMVLVRK